MAKLRTMMKGRAVQQAEFEELLKRETVSISEAAKLAHVSRRTIYSWMKTGAVKFIYTPGGLRRVFVDTLFRIAS